jgi:DNA-binding response OmpR family regulator
MGSFHVEGGHVWSINHRGGKAVAKKALVVDDEVILTEILDLVLSGNGYDVTKATDGDQAVNALETGHFDLVITDLQMGRTNGNDVARKAKELNSMTTVVMITGSCGPHYKNEAFANGVDEFLLKPFSVPDLIGRIRLLIAKRQEQPAYGHQRGAIRAGVSG